MSKPEVLIFTDGACSPNPGVGGWGAVLISPQHNNHRREISGAEAQSTNNRMELMAVIEALRSLKKPCKVQLTTDSQYVKNAFTQKWLQNWQRNGWMTSGKKPVLNQDLWQELLSQAGRHEIEWHWVKGHSTHQENNRCDQLAVEARIELAKQLK